MNSKENLAFTRAWLSAVKSAFPCVCCGATSIREFDHIVPRLDHFGAGLSAGELMQAFKSGNLQILCKPCNRSKGVTPTCYTHNTYLGLWNYLPTLDDMERV